MLADPLDGVQVRPEHLDADGRANPRRQHVDARLDGPLEAALGDAGQVQLMLHLPQQLIPRHVRTPLVLRLHHDGRFDHAQRRRIRRRLGTADLAEHPLDLRERAEDLILELEELTRLGCRDPGDSHGHVEDVALVQLRHELGPNAVHDEAAGGHRDHGDRDAQHPSPHQRAHPRTVEPLELDADRVIVLMPKATADEGRHQRRRQRDRQEGGEQHREGLGVGQRLEEPSLLCLEREDRHEGHCDDEQREEERLPHLLGRRHDRVQTVLSRSESFEAFVCVLDEDDRRVHHRTDGDRNAAKRHDVGGQSHVAHRDEGHQHRDGQDDDRHQSAWQMQEEDHYDGADDQALFD